jgi:hypothetical protein
VATIFRGRCCGGTHGRIFGSEEPKFVSGSGGDGGAFVVATWPDPSGHLLGRWLPSTQGLLRRVSKGRSKEQFWEGEPARLIVREWNS